MIRSCLHVHVILVFGALIVGSTQKVEDIEPSVGIPSGEDDTSPPELIEGGSKVEDTVGTKYLHDVPIYNYDKVSLQLRQGDSSKTEWLVVMKPDLKDNGVNSVCDDAEGGCASKGHPSEGGIGFADVKATETELGEIIKKHPGEIDFIEPAMPISIPTHEDVSEEGALVGVDANVNAEVDAMARRAGAARRRRRRSKSTRRRRRKSARRRRRRRSQRKAPAPAPPPPAMPTDRWGLDRIDDRTGQDGTYGAPNDGKGIHVYVLDTGVRTTHEDYGGRAIPTLEAYSGTNKVCNAGDTTCANDANGHGTHCAGTVGGTKSGVAKGVTLHAVKVLSDQGSGSTAGIVNAIDWVMQNSPKPSVISMSLGGKGQSQAFKAAVDRAVAANVVTVVAGGNDNADACGYAPAFVPSAITVGSTQKGDGRSGFSNYGTCTDIFAPGSDINSAWKDSDTQYKSISGTSMACPHVAGAVALLLKADKSLTPANINTKLQEFSTKDAVSNAGAGSPNRLLYVAPAPPPPAPPPPAPAARRRRNRRRSLVQAAARSAPVSAHEQ